MSELIESLLLALLLATFFSCSRLLLLGKTCGLHLFLTLLQVAKDASDLVKSRDLLEVVVHIVQGVAQVGVHDALFELSQADDHHVVRNRSILASTEPLLRFKLVV